MNYWIEMKWWMSWIESKRGKVINELNWKEVMNWIERKWWIELKGSDAFVASFQLNSFHRFLSIQFVEALFSTRGCLQKVAKLNKFTNISFKFTNISFKFSNISFKFSNISFEILENLKKNQFFKYLGTICDYSYFSAN